MSKKPILFCTQCGALVERKIPEGDDHERYVCTACGEIFYENPLNIVGTLPVWEDRVLLCRRAIDPRKGYWTLPAGHQEMKETTRDGAARETQEEAGIDFRIADEPYVYLDLAHAKPDSSAKTKFHGTRLPSTRSTKSSGFILKMPKQEIFLSTTSSGTNKGKSHNHH